MSDEFLSALLMAAVIILLVFLAIVGSYVVLVQEWTSYFSCMRWMQVLGGTPCHVFSPYRCEVGVCIYATAGAGIVEHGVEG